MADNGNPTIDGIITDLQQMGLTYQEALVYSELVTMGPSHARRVSEQAGLPREDSYRILKRLQSKGLVEVVLGSPSIFVGIEPRAAIRSFVTRLESRTQELKQKAYDLGVRLEGIKGSVPNNEEEPGNASPSLRVLSGSHVFVEVQKSLCNCRSAYVGILHPTSFLSVPGLAILETLVDTEKRGVDVRIITEFTRENVHSVRRYNRTLAIRHHSGMSQSIRFSVLDNSKTILALADAVGMSEEARVMCSETPVLARGLTFYFEEMWRESEAPVELKSRSSLLRTVGIR